MTVTRYKKDRGADDIRKAVLGVMRHVPTKPADEVTPAEQPAKPADRPAMQISEVAKMRSRRRTVRSAAQDNLFKAYQPPPGVVPAGEPILAMDDALSTWANSSFGSAVETLGGFEEGLGFVGFAYLSQLTLRPEFRRISERLATEMTRKWIRLTIAGEAKPRAKKESDDDAPVAGDAAIAPKGSDDQEDDADPGLDDDGEEVDDVGPTPEETAQRKRNDELQEKLKEIGDEMKRLDVRGKFKMVAEFDGWMGRSHLLIDTGDGDDPVKMESDLGNGSDLVSKETFKKGSLRGIKHIEPIWTYPQSYNANDPTSDDFYNPQVWMVLGKRIHASRLLTFVGRPVPDMLKPAFAFGGMSMSQMAKPYVDNWLRTRQAVTNLIESFSVSGVYTNAQSLFQGGGDEVFDRIEVFNNGRSNAGTLILDKETEEFFNITTPLGTLDQLQAQSQEQLSSVSGIPLIILLGISPHGLNASSEGELRTFYDLVLAFQEYLFRDKLHRIISFIQLNLYGEVDPAIGFEFEPLWSLDEKGEKEVKKIEAETHQLYLDMGVVGQDEVRKIVIADPDSPYNALDPDEMPEPPDQTGMIQGKSGGEEGEESDRAMDGAILTFDEWSEAEHPRAPNGRFGSGSGAGPEHPHGSNPKFHAMVTRHKIPEAASAVASSARDLRKSQKAVEKYVKYISGLNEKIDAITNSHSDPDQLISLRDIGSSQTVEEISDFAKGLAREGKIRDVLGFEDDEDGFKVLLGELNRSERDDLFMLKSRLEAIYPKAFEAAKETRRAALETTKQMKMLRKRIEKTPGYDELQDEGTDTEGLYADKMAELFDQDPDDIDDLVDVASYLADEPVSSEYSEYLQGKMEDLADEAAENKRWESLTSEQRIAEENENARKEREEDEEHTAKINKLVDAALTAGWYPGKPQPPELREMASPRSQQKIRDRVEKVMKG